MIEDNSIKKMIIDKSNGRLDEIKEFANKNELTGSFNNIFKSFENYSQKGYDVTLATDFAPLSLMFAIYKDGKYISNGGFIFHGKHDGFGNGSFPTFSVSLSTDKKAGWSIHT